jgi:hypothetical protein
LLEGSLELLGVDNPTQVTVEDVESGLNVFHLLHGDGQGGVVLGLEGFFLGALGLGGGGLCSGFCCNFAHYVKISNLIKIKIKSN